MATAWLKKCGLAQNPWERTVQVSCDAVLVSSFSQVKAKTSCESEGKGKVQESVLKV